MRPTSAPNSPLALARAVRSPPTQAVEVAVHKKSRELLRKIRQDLKDQKDKASESSVGGEKQQRLRQDVSVIEQLMTRRKGLLERMRAAELSLKDISEHQMFLSALEADLLQQRTELERKHRITEAMLKKAQGSAAGAHGRLGRS